MRLSLSFVFGTVLFLSTTFTASAREAVLSEILATVQANSANNLKSVIVMDLDETVIDTNGRHSACYREATTSLCGTAESTLYSAKSEDCEHMIGLSNYDLYRLNNGYSMQEIAKVIGIKDPAFAKSISGLMLKCYSSGREMDKDSVMPGASEYVRELKRVGAIVNFVSSRHADTQLTPTYTSLITLGFILDTERSTVFLRDPAKVSVVFKTESIKNIKAKSLQDGTPVVALFENEPENLNAWIAEFPTAKAVFVKGSIGNTKVQVDPSATVISSYR